MSVLSPSCVCRLYSSHLFSPLVPYASYSRFGASFLFSISDWRAVSLLKQTAETAINDYRVPSTTLKRAKNPLRYSAGILGFNRMFVLYASAPSLPEIIDASGSPMTLCSEPPDGSLCNITVSFFPYSQNGFYGSAARLKRIVFLHDIS